MMRFLYIGFFIIAIGIGFVVMQNHDAVAEVEKPAGGEAVAWVKRCSEVTEKSPTQHCEIVQRLSVKDTGARLVEFAISARDKKEKASRGVIILPLGILLESGVTMQIDDGQQLTFNVRFCEQGGCVAYLTLSDDVLAIMKKGKVAKLGFIGANGQRFALDMSLKGLTAGLKGL